MCGCNHLSSSNILCRTPKAERQIYLDKSRGSGDDELGLFKNAEEIFFQKGIGVRVGVRYLAVVYAQSSRVFLPPPR